MTDDIVALVKLHNPLEEVIEGDGYPLSARGRYRKCTRRGIGGLVIDTQRQTYHWNSRGEWGDVIAWVEREHKLDFKAAVEWLAKRATLPEPRWREVDHEQRLAARKKEEALDVAQRVFIDWFWKDGDAQAYASRRGWTAQEGEDEDGENIPGTMRRALLGYSGKGTDDERRHMRKALEMADVDLDSPAAVAILGMRGAKAVADWAKRHGVQLDENWLRDGYIPGMIGRKRLVYPHVHNGRIGYLSGRCVDEKKHYNLPEALVGARQPFFNHAYAPAAEVCVVVEGQADAVSLAQLGIGAMALAGVAKNENLTDLLKHHKVVYVGLDVDESGRRNAWRVADALGPLTRLVTWQHEKHLSFTDSEGDPQPVKDANDLLLAMVQSGATVEEQRTLVHGMLSQAPTYAESMAAWAGAQNGAARDDAQRQALEVILRIDELTLAQYRGKLAKLLGMSVRDFTHVLKTMATAAKEESKPGDIVFTLGGYIEGYLVEYLYDPEENQVRLVWKTPEGKIESGFQLDIDGVRYLPEPPNKFIKDGGVLFSSELGQLKSTRELVAYVDMFISQSYLLEDRNLAKIIAYYVMLTWVYDSFNALPYLRAMGEPGAGKSELMRRVGYICYRLMTASGANTASSFFRATEKYRGTVFIDEADLHDGGDMSNDLVKFLNLGAMKGNPIWRLIETVMPDGSRGYEVGTFSTFCPKLIAMRKEFRDDAVSTRSITLKLQPREAFELKDAGVKLHIDEEFRKKALALRNLLLRWRMETWQPEITINEDDIDLEISSRLNQVTVALLAIAKDDPELKKDIRQFLREYYAELVLTRSMTMAARIVEALWKIYTYPDLRGMYLAVDENNNEYVMVGDVRRIANEIVDDMNRGGDEESEDEEKKPRRKGKGDELTARGVGSIIRNELQLRVGKRRNSGFPVIWDENRMKALAKRYGVDYEEIGKAAEESKASGAVEKQATPTKQEGLGV